MYHVYQTFSLCSGFKSVPSPFQVRCNTVLNPFPMFGDIWIFYRRCLTRLCRSTFSTHGTHSTHIFHRHPIGVKDWWDWILLSVRWEDVWWQNKHDKSINLIFGNRIKVKKSIQHIVVWFILCNFALANSYPTT